MNAPGSGTGWRRRRLLALAGVFLMILSLVAIVAVDVARREAAVANEGPSGLTGPNDTNSVVIRAPEAFTGRVLVALDSPSAAFSRLLENPPDGATIQPLEGSAVPADTAAVVVDAAGLQRLGDDWIREQFESGRIVVAANVEMEDLAQKLAPQMGKAERDDGFSVTPGRIFSSQGIDFYSIVTGGTTSPCGHSTYSATEQAGPAGLWPALRLHLACVAPGIRSGGA